MDIDAKKKLKAEFDKVIVELMDLYIDFTQQVEMIKSQDKNKILSIDKIDQLYSNYKKDVDLKVNNSKLLYLKFIIENNIPFTKD
ncbi:MAG: hypothetical protein LBJ61_00575 [Deltaproteobacteria bacterium]|jgi:hypothetical protein|nr:hypothetical protein [Deltaproteobacteria bacterium]